MLGDPRLPIVGFPPRTILYRQRSGLIPRSTVARRDRAAILPRLATIEGGRRADLSLGSKELAADHVRPRRATGSPHALHRASPAVSREHVCVSGALAAEPGALDRRESQPRQGLQLRLHLLPGRSPQRGGHRLRRDRAAPGGARADARPGRVGGDLSTTNDSARPPSRSAGSTTSPSRATASRRRSATSTGSSPRWPRSSSGGGSTRSSW